MQYLISDIHGNLHDFRQLLNKIAFDKEKDNLIIMGDILDRGPDGIKLLEFIKPYLLEKSMELLLGNHELFAIMYIKGILDERTWTIFGGGDTVKEINRMSIAKQEELLAFLKELPYYAEISSKFLGDIVVTHTGIDCDNYVMNIDGTINIKKSIEKAIRNNLYNFMVGTDLHQIPVADKKKFDNYLIVGHVPCYRLNKDMSNKFYRTKYYMDIDAGAGHKEQGGVLGCYCVTTDEETYLQQNEV